MLWKDLLMCHVRITITFIVTDRQNKSIITITSQQLIKSVCCSASHRQRYRGYSDWIECLGCEGEHSSEWSAEVKKEFCCNCV